MGQSGKHGLVTISQTRPPKAGAAPRFDESLWADALPMPPAKSAALIKVERYHCYTLKSIQFCPNILLSDMRRSHSPQRPDRGAMYRSTRLCVPT
jgi:hypothetical protein